MSIKVTRSVIPNLFTVMNLFCGFLAIVAAADHEYMRAGWMIVLGGVFDTLDGVMARLTRSSSEFGVELDSLCDAVTFGVAPSFLVYQLYFHALNPAGVLIAALPAIAGALRLARFNVQLVGFDKDYFRGLPIPSAALLIVSYVNFFYDSTSAVALARSNAILAVLTVAASLLMVSTIKYDTIPKFSRAGVAAHPIKFAAFVAGLTLAIATRGQAIFPLFVVYIVAGAVRSVAHRISVWRHHGDEPFDAEEHSVEV
jgi:CDP-diacylglycerol--serine O-phosphatidyltransferase